MRNKVKTAKDIYEGVKNEIAPLPCQENYIKQMSNIFSYHNSKQLLLDTGLSPHKIPQISAIIVAPTGSGKTFIMEQMAKQTGVNFIKVDCSSLSHEGWKGSSISMHLMAAKERAETPDKFARSILFLDEVDKLKYRYEGHDSGNAMENLLNLFNTGTIVAETGTRSQTESIDISKFTIVLGGAFAGLDEIIRTRKFKGNKIGFSTVESQKDTEVSASELYLHCEQEDLVSFGLMPELVGRVSTFVFINPLKYEDYEMLLTAPTGSVQANYNTYFNSLYGVSFEITPKAIEKISDHCTKKTYGARAVNPFVNNILTKTFSTVEEDLEINKVILDADGEECFVRYEKGERAEIKVKIRDIELKTIDFSSEIGSLEGIENTALKLLSCTEIQDERTISCFLNIITAILCFMHVALNKDEQNFESLYKLLNCLDTNPLNKSVLDLLIEEESENEAHPKEIKEKMVRCYEEYKWQRNYHIEHLIQTIVRTMTENAYEMFAKGKNNVKAN